MSSDLMNARTARSGVTARSWKLGGASQRLVGMDLRDPITSAPVRIKRKPPSMSGAEPSSVLVDGMLVTGAADRAGVAVAPEDGAGVAVAPDDGAGVAVAIGVELGDGDATVEVITKLTVAMHLVNAPPPFVEPLH
jgi:hypothetical protein